MDPTTEYINPVGHLHLHTGDDDLDHPGLVLLFIVILLGIHSLIIIIRNDLLAIHRLFCVTWSSLKHNGLISLQMSYSSFNNVLTAPLELVVKKWNFVNIEELEIKRIMEEDKEKSCVNIEK